MDDLLGTAYPGLRVPGRPRIFVNPGLRDLGFRKSGVLGTRIFGNPKSRGPGFSGIRGPGYPDFRKSGVPGTWISGNPGLRTPGFSEIRGSGDPDFQKSGVPGTRISRNPGSPGDSNSWKSGYPDSWISGFLPALAAGVEENPQFILFLCPIWICHE